MVGAAPVGERVQLWLPCRCPRNLPRRQSRFRKASSVTSNWPDNESWCAAPTSDFLLLLTVVVLFASTWLALFLSKLVNRPVAALAAGTEAISKGQLDYRVDIRATDELAELVQSFNSMAEQLESSRGQIEASSRELGVANEALERRRRHIETILESIPTGRDFDRRRAPRHPGRMRRCCACFISTGRVHAIPAALVNVPLRDLLPDEVLDRSGTAAATRRPHGHDGRQPGT